MRFGTTKSPSSPSKPTLTHEQTGTGIFAVACTLQSHLHAIEQRFLSGRETNDSLRRRKNELTEVLRLFRIVEENEVALSNELEVEVEVAVRECGLGYEDAAEIRLDPGADVEVIMERSGRRMRMRAADDKENNHSSPTNVKPGTFKPRVAIPPRWKKVIALSASASPSRARTSASASATTTLSGTGTLPSTGTPPLSLTLSTLSQPTSPDDTASISSSTPTTGGLGLCGSLRTSKLSRSKSKFHNSKSKVKSTTTKKNFKLNRRRSSGSDGTWSAKPYKTRTTKRARSASLRSPVLLVYYKTGNTNTGAGNSGTGGLGGGGMWNATRVDNAGAGTSATGDEGAFRFVM